MTAVLIMAGNHASGAAQRVAEAYAECRRRGIDILPPDVNRSGVNFQLEPQARRAQRAIRFGLANIKNVGEGVVEGIIEAREDGSRSPRVEDFFARVNHRHLNKRALESMVKAGAFDSLCGARGGLLASLDRAIALAQRTQRQREAGQGSLFDLMGEEAKPSLAGRCARTKAGDAAVGAAGLGEGAAGGLRVGAPVRGGGAGAGAAPELPAGGGVGGDGGPGAGAGRHGHRHAQPFDPRTAAPSWRRRWRTRRAAAWSLRSGPTRSSRRVRSGRRGRRCWRAVRVRSEATSGSRWGCRRRWPTWRGSSSLGAGGRRPQRERGEWGVRRNAERDGEQRTSGPRPPRRRRGSPAHRAGGDGRPRGGPGAAALSGERAGGVRGRGAGAAIDTAAGRGRGADGAAAGALLPGAGARAIGYRGAVGEVGV